MFRLLTLLFVLTPTWLAAQAADKPTDYLAELQEQAIRKKHSPAAHWGTDPEKYITWSSHSTRLIPVYAFGTKNAGKGVDLTDYTGLRSPYRSRGSLQVIYEELPTNTVNPQADYLDQTNLATLQRAALAAGKKHIFLVVFDGMDWQTTQMAAIYKTRSIPYTQGRGQGLHFLDYTAGGNTQYAYMVTAARSQDAKLDVNTQRVTELQGLPGGYNVEKGGPNPWTPGNDKFYLIGKTATGQKAEHGYPDSAMTATAMCSGVKSYNAAINVDWTGQQVETVAHQAQRRGYSVGVVTSVPISHATPSASYAHNVSRDDYQDLTRDLLGLPSISHPDRPLKGVDVLIGSGWGVNRTTDSDQGANFVPGNRYLTEKDLTAANLANGGKYLVSQRTKGLNGTRELQVAAEKAVQEKHRLLGFYGVAKTAHLPFQTADGNYNPVRGLNAAEEYTPADREENPLLADMTRSALTVLEANKNGFWLMVESGDVDWANHDNNMDNSIGAVFSGDAAIKVITDWVEKNSNWSESLLIVTADHGHYMHLDQPELLIPPQPPESATPAVPEKTSAHRPALMAHRGLAQLAPENTLAAFGAALDLRLDLELDVYLTKDHELVVIHDETVDRTTNGQGKVTEMTLAEVQALDAGKWFSPEFAGLQAPTLGQVFEFVKQRQQRPTTIAINLKTISPNIESLIAREVTKHGMLDRVYCFDMNEASHARFKTANPRLPTAISTTGYREGMDLKKPQDWEAAVADRTVEVLWVNFLPTPEQIEQARQRRKQVWLYIRNDRDLMRKAALSTLDGICSDYVLEIRTLQNEQNAATGAVP